MSPPTATHKARGVAREGEQWHDVVAHVPAAPLGEVPAAVDHALQAGGAQSGWLVMAHRLDRRPA